MPFYSIPLGIPVTIPQNTPYSLPTRVVRVLTSAAIEYSVSSSGPWTAVNPVANTVGVEGVGGFIRCPTAACDVICGAY